IGRLDTSFIRDRRNDGSSYSTSGKLVLHKNAVDPTHGTLTTANFQIANRNLGSEVDFLSFYYQTSYYRPVPGGVFATSLRAGWKHPYGGDVDLPISERYFAGGSSTLRGFKLDDAGPGGGGQVLLVGNAEYRFPLNFLPIRNLFGG